MGLAEKRAIEAYKSGNYRNHIEAINGITGFTVNFDVKWDTFAKEVEGYSDPTASMKEFLDGVFFEPIKSAFKDICADDMGKNALKESLKAVEIYSTGEKYSGSGVTFDGGVLKFDDKYTNMSDLQYRTDAVRTSIEKKL